MPERAGRRLLPGAGTVRVDGECRLVRGARCLDRSGRGSRWSDPGPHRWEPGRQPELDEIAYAEMEAGSVLVYTGSVIHGGGRNDTHTPRVGLHLHNTLNWLRQEENQYLTCPPTSRSPSHQNYEPCSAIHPATEWASSPHRSHPAKEPSSSHPNPSSVTPPHTGPASTAIRWSRALLHRHRQSDQLARSLRARSVAEQSGYRVAHFGPLARRRAPRDRLS